jgi:hypothetical protein
MHFVRHNAFFENDYSKEVYNKKMSKMYDQTFEFIELHYYSNRSDSAFWKDISTHRSKNLLNLIKKAENSFLTNSDILVDFDRIQGSSIFGLTGYTRLMLGLNLLNTNGAKYFLKISGLSSLGNEVFDKVQTVKDEIHVASVEAPLLYKRIKYGKRNL